MDMPCPSHFMLTLTTWDELTLLAWYESQTQPLLLSDLHNFVSLTLTLQQGSIISSFAATFATQPFVTLFRYTIGV